MEPGGWTVLGEEELTKKYNALYLEIIMRYKDVIETGETIYVAELPKLVTPEDETVLSVAGKMTSGFHIYNYEENFLEAARNAHNYVQNEIATISPPVQFWLRPSQVVNLQAGDIFDKVVLLCSVLIALGNPSATILTAVREEDKRHVVLCEYKGELLVIDLEDGITTVKSKEEALAMIGIKTVEGMTAYEFNNRMYNDLV